MKGIPFLPDKSGLLLLKHSMSILVFVCVFPYRRRLFSPPPGGGLGRFIPGKQRRAPGPSTPAFWAALQMSQGARRWPYRPFPRFFFFVFFFFFLTGHRRFPKFFL